MPCDPNLVSSAFYTIPIFPFCLFSCLLGFLYITIIYMGYNSLWSPLDSYLSDYKADLSRFLRIMYIIDVSGANMYV